MRMPKKKLEAIVSEQRRCNVFKAVDAQWYLVLGKFEYAERDEDCMLFGPFRDQDEAETEITNHSNPGAWSVDDRGVVPVPVGAVKPSSFVIWRVR